MSRYRIIMPPSTLPHLVHSAHLRTLATSLTVSTPPLDIRTRVMTGIFVATFLAALAFAIFAQTALPLATMILFQGVAVAAVATTFDALAGIPGAPRVRLQPLMPLFAGLAFSMPVFLFARYEYAPTLLLWPFLTAEVIALAGLFVIGVGAWRLRLSLERLRRAHGSPPM